MISLVVYIVGLKMKGSSWVFVSLCWFRYAGGTHSHFFEHSQSSSKNNKHLCYCSSRWLKRQEVERV